MATLTVRNLPDKVHAALRVKAAKNGRSIEAEVRAILAESAVAEARPPVDLNKVFARVRAQIRKANGGKMPKDGVETFLRERRKDWGEE
jgi:plasmid stability protein